MKFKWYKILGYLQVFIGMSAVSGGLPMLLDPDGTKQGFSLELLNDTPFDNYLIPGLLLFSVNGIGSLFASYFSLKLKPEAGILGIIFGVGLMVWISIQFLLLGFSSWLQAFYLLIGIAEFILGLKIYKKQKAI